MGIFNTKKASYPAPKKSVKAPVKEEVLTPAAQTAASETVKTVAPAKGQAGESYRILRSPRVSEKAAVSASKNVYVFEVPVNSEKVEIAKAVEALFGVKVEAVNTARGIGKRFTGRRHGQRQAWKKAYVRVKSGQKIDLYEGV